ncbi:MAG: glycosyltransferase family 4 protein [Acidimicrobiaceae bacterium]|nr:glycosyltransferase family 4 protein [Acidimicrobiaceae bacterium]
MSPYALSVFGGVQEQVLAMSRELSRRGILVQVIAPDSHDLTTYDTPARIERFGRLISIPANGSRAPLTLSVAASRRAARRIHEFDPQVVHFHEPFAPLVGWSTLREHNAAAVGTFHRSGEGPAVSMAAPFLRRWAHHLDINAAVSEQAAATAHSSCGVQTKVLFNGFETTRFVEFDREQQPIATVVVLGRLESRKGVMTAIEAVRAHNERHENPWRLVIIGDGPERTSLVAAGGTDGAVQFLGAVSDIEKRRWYRRADVLVAPATHGESFGLILLEAMASETPVVASDIPGYRDAAGAHALLFAPGNSASLEQAISMSLARDHWNPGPALLHAEHWSMSRLVDDYFTLYQSARERFGALR